MKNLHEQSQSGNRFMAKVMPGIVAAAGAAALASPISASADASIGYEYNGGNYCSTQGGAIANACSPLATSVTNYTGSDVAYMSGDTSGTTGGAWAGTNNAGMWFGGGSPQAATNRVVVDAFGVTLQGGAITLAGTNGVNVSNTQIRSLAKGTADTDAINLSQLKTLARSTVDALGGGSIVNADGSFTAPSFTVHNADGSTTTANSVGAAISNLDNRTTQNTNDINVLNQQLNNGAVGLVQQNPASRSITVAKDTDGTVVDMTGTQGARTVIGVAAGLLSADSQEAVNGSQLYATNQNVDSLTQQVANFQSGGNSAFASQANDTPAVASGANSTAIGNGSNATGSNSVALGSRSVADEDNTVSVGSAGNERRVTNVAPGVRGTDAANMNQLNAVQSSVNTTARQAFAGVAAAMAMPTLTPSQPGRTVVAAGVGNYKGYSAVGVGATYRSRDSHWLVNGAASFTSGDTGMRAQVGYEF